MSVSPTTAASIYLASLVRTLEQEVRSPDIVSSSSAMASIGGLNGDKGDSAMEVEEAATSGPNASSKDDHEVAGEGGEINDDEAMEEEEEEEEEVDDDVEDNGDEEEDAHGKRPSEIVVRQKHCRFDQFQGTSRYKKYGSVIQSQDTGSVSKDPCTVSLVYVSLSKAKGTKDTP